MIHRKKGFTLAELLIVVAIIAVLTAVSIPVFVNQLEKAREAVDFSNLRVALEEVAQASLSQTKEIYESEDDPYDHVVRRDGAYEMWVKVTQTVPKWQSYGGDASVQIAGYDVEVPDVGKSAYWIVQLVENNQLFVINKSE